jgi:hypothetical protein
MGLAWTRRESHVGDSAAAAMAPDRFKKVLRDDAFMCSPYESGICATNDNDITIPEPS